MRKERKVNTEWWKQEEEFAIVISGLRDDHY